MPAQDNRSFFIRFFIYQKERFPFLAHGLLIGAFTFSAISYSRICRGMQDFVPLKTYLVGVFITVTLFLLVRIFDEFKDRELDARYRKYLPVPRGLVTLGELRNVGLVTVVLQLVVLISLYPSMMILYAVVMAFLLLMGAEFFVPRWLNKNQMAYVASHMFIIPLIDVFASGLDWHLAGVPAPRGLVFFFAVSYMNGIVLEFGRKIKTPENEEDGVVSYTGLFGTGKGTLYWILLLFITLILSIIAAWFAGYTGTVYLWLVAVFLICSLPGFLFIRQPRTRYSKWIEYASAIWTFTMYMTLGGVPMLKNLITG